MVGALDQGSSGPHSWFELRLGTLCSVFLGKNKDYISISLMCHLAHMQTFPLPYCII